MATMDEGVANLQRFIGLLANATAATGAVADHVKEAARQFGELDGDAEEEGGGLNDQLIELATTLGTEEAEALGAMTELIQAVTAAQGVAGDAQQKAEEAAGDLDQKVNAIETRIEEGSAQVTSEGFQPLDQALEDLQQELETESQEEQQAFTELETAVGGFATESEAAWNEAEDELEEARTALTEGETTLESESAEGVQAFNTAATEIETACTSLQTDVDKIYDAFDQGVETQGQAWQSAVQAATREALTFVTEAQKLQVDAPAAMVEDEALALLNQEYEALGTVLDAATAAVGELEPLAEDLVKCQSVVGDIDQLMKALAS